MGRKMVKRKGMPDVRRPSGASITKKARQAQVAQQKRQRNTRYGLIGLAAVAIIVLGILFIRQQEAASLAAIVDELGELSGVQIDGSPDAPIQIVEYADFLPKKNPTFLKFKNVGFDVLYI